MSREIKFRGKRTDNGEWVYGFYLYGAILDEHIIWTDNETWKVDGETVGQYTGRPDKTGREIYDDDIFDAPHDFGPGGFDVRRAIVKFHDDFGYQWNYWLMDQLEIIGNIHDNPELTHGT